MGFTTDEWKEIKTGIDKYLSSLVTVAIEDREDIEQDAMLKAFRFADQFKGDSTLSTWGYRIAANTANTFLAKKKLHNHRELPMWKHEEFGSFIDDQSSSSEQEELWYEYWGDLVPTESPLEYTETEQAVEALCRMLVKMNSRRFSICYGRYVLGHSHEEIADYTGIPLSTVSNNLHRASLAIAAKMGRYMDSNGNEEKLRVAIVRAFTLAQSMRSSA